MPGGKGISQQLPLPGGRHRWDVGKELLPVRVAAREAVAAPGGLGWWKVSLPWQGWNEMIFMVFSTRTILSFCYLLLLPQGPGQVPEQVPEHSLATERSYS